MRLSHQSDELSDQERIVHHNDEATCLPYAITEIVGSLED